MRGAATTACGLDDGDVGDRKRWTFAGDEAGRPCPVESVFWPSRHRGHDVDEIIFVVEEPPEGGWSARALGAAIFTEADDLEALQTEVRDAVICHFEDEADPG
jgi:hypothetical protein